MMKTVQVHEVHAPVREEVQAVATEMTMTITEDHLHADMNRMEMDITMMMKDTAVPDLLAGDPLQEDVHRLHDGERVHAEVQAAEAVALAVGDRLHRREEVLHDN